MSSDVANSVRNIFSRSALRMLNACGKFVYHFAYGFGIKFTDASGSKAVAIDTESEALKEWIKNTTHEHKDTKETETLLSGYNEIGNDASVATRNTDSWKIGDKDVEIFALCRQTDGGTEGALFFRKLKVNRTGHIVAIGEEDENFGWAITATPS
ncbi:MAG: hypothetical protein J6R18_02720 [Kiritimatiellae bacterium]|nr:hypothetical protein [Kiritimatiellia bacterium]